MRACRGNEPFVARQKTRWALQDRDTRRKHHVWFSEQVSFLFQVASPDFRLDIRASVDRKSIAEEQLFEGRRQLSEMKDRLVQVTSIFLHRVPDHSSCRSDDCFLASSSGVVGRTAG